MHGCLNLNRVGATSGRGLFTFARLRTFEVNTRTIFDDELRRQPAKMRIVELIIDGFKSYAVRTVISGWDDSFNSITGLNGSGKSNILDAICFCQFQDE
jgi:hypothetical protein